VSAFQLRKASLLSLNEDHGKDFKCLTISLWMRLRDPCRLQRKKGVKDGSSSSSALLAASSQLSSKHWFARAIVRISFTMSTESSTRNHFFDILKKIKQFSERSEAFRSWKAETREAEMIPKRE
nr:hypothetical protein [Tanacetum cinerariifolium]